MFSTVLWDVADCACHGIHGIVCHHIKQCGQGVFRCCLAKFPAVQAWIGMIQAKCLCDEVSTFLAKDNNMTDPLQTKTMYNHLFRHVYCSFLFFSSSKRPLPVIQVARKWSLLIGKFSRLTNQKNTFIMKNLGLLVKRYLRWLKITSHFLLLLWLVEKKSDHHFAPASLGYV